MAIQSAFTLNPNEIFSSLANMIISQQVFADNIGNHQTLVDKARVDGGLFGDKKLYYATDILETEPWDYSGDATKLIGAKRPKDPEVQDITLDVFRQIKVTIDHYLSKRAWSTEGAFNEFNSVMLGWLQETKKVYDGTTYNTFIGTAVSANAGQNITVTLTQGKEAQSIAQAAADLLVEMSDYSRDFNDYGFMRSYNPADVKFIWNAKALNEIKKVDLPTIFHKDGLVDKIDGADVLPAKYFGTVITATNIGSYSDSTPAAGKPIKSSDGSYVPGTNHANGTLRSLVEKSVKVSNVDYHVIPGQEIPAGATVGTGKQFGSGEVYIEDAKVLFKAIVKYPPYMSAFEVATSFYNAQSLYENNFLTFGHNTLKYLKNYPMITVKKS